MGMYVCGCPGEMFSPVIILTVCESVCVRACVCAFMLYALNFDNMYL